MGIRSPNKNEFRSTLDFMRTTLSVLCRRRKLSFSGASGGYVRTAAFRTDQAVKVAVFWTAGVRRMESRTAKTQYTKQPGRGSLLALDLPLAGWRLLFASIAQRPAAVEWLGAASMHTHVSAPTGRIIPARGKRGTSAAPGQGSKMISSFFPSGSARLRRAEPEGKKEIGRGGVLPRAAASAAFPWAGMTLPFQGVGRANQRADEMHAS